MKRSTITIVCAIMLIAAGIFLYNSTGNYSDIVGIDVPAELLELACENRIAALPKPLHNLHEILEEFKTPNLDAETDALIAQRIEQARRGSIIEPTELTHEQIIYELAFLFEVLRYGYGAYQYFGGDDVFVPLHEAMLEQLAQMNDPLAINTYILHLLRPALESVISDNHFWLGYHQIGATSRLYMNSDFVIHRADNGFVTEMDGVLHRIVEVMLEGEQADGILPTLTEGGQFAWKFGLVVYGSQRLTSRYMYVILENAEKGEKTEFNVQLALVPSKIPAAMNPNAPMSALSRRNGIPILQSRHLRGASTENFDNSFTRTGAALQSEPVTILDLRGNRGGNSGYAWEWVYQYTGQYPSLSGMFTQVRPNSLTVNALTPWVQSASPPTWQIINNGTPHTFIPNKNLLIVLTDNNIGSAAESFVGYLRQLENTLIVGTNTSGARLTTYVGDVRLPHSRIVVHFGVALNVRSDLSQFEGVGFAPDLWVPPGESLDWVLRFIERYGIVDTGM